MCWEKVETRREKENTAEDSRIEVQREQNHNAVRIKIVRNEILEKTREDSKTIYEILVRQEQTVKLENYHQQHKVKAIVACCKINS